MNDQPTTPNIVKYTYQHCLEYSPATNKSLWHMIAEWSDSKTRSAYLWLADGEQVTGDEPEWTEQQ